MELEYSVLADIAAPRPDGKLDLHGVGWDTIFAAGVPTIHPRMDLALRFRLSAVEVESEHKVGVVLMDPDGDRLAQLSATVPPMDQALRERLAHDGRHAAAATVITFGQTGFCAYGPHALIVTWDGTEVRRLTLHVSPTPTPPAGA